MCNGFTDYVLAYISPISDRKKSELEFQNMSQITCGFQLLNKNFDYKSRLQQLTSTLKRTYKNVELDQEGECLHPKHKISNSE